MRKNIRVTVLIIKLLVCGLCLSHVQASEEFYVPFPEDHTQAFLSSITSSDACTNIDSNLNPLSPISTVTDLVVRVDNSIVYIDHWEDGYDADITDAPAASTLVLGDGNVANGAALGVTTNAGDVLTSGQVIIYEEIVNIATLQGVVDIDGGDRIFSTETINATRAQWATGSGTLFAGAFELFPTTQWGTNYTVPAGEDSGSVMFEWTGATIMAANNGTVVSVDADADGVFELSQTLNQGQTLEIIGVNGAEGGLRAGAKISSTDIIQVNVITGQDCSTYAARWYTLFPDSLLGSSYYEPVSTRIGDATQLFLYNPNPFSITVNWETSTGLQAPISIAGFASAIQTMPADSGAHFFNNNNNSFGAFTAIDSNATAHDWGHASTPRRLMGNVIQVGFAEGDDPSTDLAYDNNGENASPVWLVADDPVDPSNTIIDVCVDVSGDGGPNTDSITGRTYDYTFQLNRLDSARLYDGGRDTPNDVPAHIDGDQSGMLAFVCESSDAILAAAWGQAPNNASLAAPAIDFGTTVRSTNDNDGFIGDTIFIDGNADGIQNAGEQGGAGITVTLTPPPTVDIGNGPGQLISTTTDSLGTYLFTNLPTVSGYVVTVLKPSTFTQTADPDGVLDDTSTVSLIGGGGVLDQDFGYESNAPVGQIGDFIYADTNGDGLQSPGELGIAGIDVQLCFTSNVVPTAQFDFGPAGASVGSGYIGVTNASAFPTTAGVTYGWTTAGSGDFNRNLADPLRDDYVYHSEGSATAQFAVNLPNGSYDLSYGFGDPILNGNGFSVGPTDVTIEGVLVHSALAMPLPGNLNLSSTVTVTDGQLNFDFAATVDGTSSYTALNYLTITPTPAENCQTDTTDANGAYLFTGLSPNVTYTVTVLNPPAGATNSQDPDGGVANQSILSLTSMSGNLEQDFGYFTPATVTGHVYLDSNGNGVQDSGEPDLANVDVQITDSNNNLHIVTTDANGDYSVDVPAGATTVKIDESDPQYPTDFIQTEGNDPTVVTAVSGATTSAGNDGFYQGGSIGDFIFNSTDSSGIANVIVTLTPPAGVDLGAGSGQPMMTTTDSQGNYLFVGLPNGSYTVTVTPPGGSTQMSDPDASLDNMSVVMLSGGVVNLNQDFGYVNNVATGQIGDMVFNDTNGNGLQDGGEAGVQNITVQLCGDLDDNNATANTCITDVTDASGNYLFTGLPNSTGSEVYTVTVLNPPAGTVNSADPDGGNNNFSQLSLSGLGGNLDQDFGYLTPGTVSGHLYFDTNGNGAQDSGEPDLVNIDVVITDVNGITQTVATDGNGNYTATVPEGSTTVDVDENDPQFPANVAQTEGNDPTVVTAVSGGNVDAGNDGYSRVGSISGTVLEDTTGNGLGDTALSSVVVQLYTDPNGDGNPDDGVLVSATTTDASGNYQFSGVTANNTNYVIVEVDPANYASVNDVQSVDGDTVANGNLSDNLIPVTLATGETDANNNFVDVRPASIAGTVWLDEDLDGINDIEEVGLTAIRVELVDGDNNVVATVATDAFGHYIFTDVVPGGYTVNVVDASLPTGLTNTVGSDGVNPDPDPKPVTVNAGDRIEEINFGYVPTAGTGMIGDRVWNDGNGNGIQEAGEPGIANVTVELSNVSGVVVATTTTNSNGDYLFTNVALADDYVVNVTTTGTALDNFSPTSGPQSEGGFSSRPVSLDASLTVVSDVDFGFNRTVSNTIVDTVWFDANNNGLFDVDESPLANVTVNLYNDLNNDGVPDDADSDGQPNVLATAITDENGDAQFTGLVNGSYLLAITDINSVLLGLNGTTEEGVVKLSETVTVIGGVTDDQNSFGYNNPGLVAGTIYSDANADAAQQSHEVGLGGVTVTLSEDTDDNGSFDTVIGSVLTSADGGYQFDGLPAGDYQVVVTPPAGTQTGDPDAVINDRTDITLGVGDSSVGNDFGYNNSSFNNISGTIFLDSDKDGVEDAGEAGIAQVTISLLDAAGNIIATTKAESDGSYQFTGLPDGDYQIAVTDSDGLLAGYDLTSGLDILGVTLDGTDVTDVDFGYINDEATGSISGEVFLDENNNAVAEGAEANYSNVDVYLCRSPVAAPPCDPSDPEFVAQAKTDSNGEYVFHDLPADHYVVAVDATDIPAGLNNTVQPSVIALSEGETVAQQNFGYSAVDGLIEGAVWVDANSNGIYDLGEAPIAGVDIRVFDPESGSTAIGTVTTGVDGSWSFPVNPLDTNLYITYDENDIPTNLDSIQPSNLPLGDVSWVNIDVTNATNNIVSDLNFGFAPAPAQNLGSITGTIYFDVDRNGGHAASIDDEFQGVSINLLDDSGNVIATTFTDANGNYSFTGLVDGNYTVQVSDVDNVLVNLNVNETIAGPINISAGNDVTGADQGYVSDERLGSIGNLVWVDVDQDGFVDDGEPRVAGVSVQCWLDNNNSTTPNDPGAVQAAPEPGIDNLIRTVMTDENGEYSCTSLPEGQYIVTVTDINNKLAGYTSTAPNNSSNNPADHWAKPLTYTVTTSGSPSDNSAAVDFGVVAPASIAGTVYFDENSDSTYQAMPAGNDSPLANLTVQACKDNGATCVSVLSDASGHYLIPVTPADWVVSVVTPLSGTEATEDDGASPITVSTGDSITDVNFGFTEAAITTTPVSVSYFYASDNGSGVTFHWQTSMEVGSAGFQLYVRTEDGWQLINQQMIPSKVINSMDSTDYEHSVYHLDGQWFALVEVSVAEGLTVHGPYRLDKQYGENSEIVQLNQQVTEPSSAGSTLDISRFQQRLNRLQAGDQ